MTASIDTLRASAELALLIEHVLDPVPFFDYVGVTERQKIRERITYTKIDPSGKRWMPWSPYTADKRDHFGTFAQGIMWETGKLLNSIEFAVDGSFGVDIGTDVWYAPKHQLGEGRIPQREIFGWDDNALPRLAAVFVLYLERGSI